MNAEFPPLDPSYDEYREGDPAVLEQWRVEFEAAAERTIPHIAYELQRLQGRKDM